MLNEWKCESCNKWNSLPEAEDYCYNCGKSKIILSESDKISITNRLDINDLGGITIYPTDSMILKFIKRILMFLRFVFFAILSIFLWLVAVSHG